MKLRNSLMAFAVLLSCHAFGQQTEGPSVVSQGIFVGATIPLRAMPTAPEMEAEGFDYAREIKQKFDPSDQNAVLNENDLPLEGQHQGYQSTQGTRDPLTVLQNFQGSSIQEGQAIPPDPTGAVGPNHYVHAVNSVVKIFDKTGGLLAGPTTLGTFLGNGNSNGDPIVMYDHLADRFFVSQFNIGTNSLIIGISQTSDPTGSYNVYDFPLDAFPDYPHYSVWHDGYYLTANKTQGNKTYVLDRQAMIDGDLEPTIIGFNLPQFTRNPFTVISPEPANLIGNDADTDSPAFIVYLQDGAWNGIDFDHLKVWTIETDFVNPNNSTISQPQEIPTAPFDSFIRQFGQGDFRQPNTDQRLDGATGVISYAANYRSFADHNSWVITFNEDMGAQRGGIRWIELRNTDADSTWSIFQEGSYAPNDGESRFMSSAGMDQDGNIGMAYNISSANTYASIRYTGRYDGDAMGEMTFPEGTIWDGTSWQTNTNRFGDYAHLTMDPDGVTFWHTSEYFQGVNQWRTRIASFTLNNGFSEDIGVFNFETPVSGDALTDAETVTVKLFNFGTAPQTNFEIALRVNGTLIDTETFTETIAPFSEAMYTFNTTVDLSTPQEEYEIEARTILTGDSNTPNDSFTKTINNTTLSVRDQEFNSGDFAIISSGSKQYEVTFTTTKDFGAISYSVYNTMGQEVFKGLLASSGQTHTTRLDFNAQPVGVFFVTLTNGAYKAAKRVVVFK
jgi:hypothetical protein